MNEIITSKGIFILQDISLPIPNGYTLLCTTDTITDDIAKNIVDRDECGFIINYVDSADCCETYLDSFKSLLQSLNLSPLKNYAICKKVN